MKGIQKKKKKRVNMLMNSGCVCVVSSQQKPVAIEFPFGFESKLRTFELNEQKR